jgi:hypothetical protein
MHRLFGALHGTLGSNLGAALREGGAADVAYVSTPWT